MKPNPAQFRKSFTWAAVAALCVFSVRPAVSAPATWTGGAAPDGNWTTAGNWGGVAPSALDLLTFAGTTQLQATNDFATGTIFNNLSFGSTAGAFALAQPLLAAAVLTLMLGWALIATGAVRIWLGTHLLPGSKSMMILAGIATLLFGLVIVIGWPGNSFFVLGIILGLDLLFYGASMIAFGMRLRNA